MSWTSLQLGGPTNDGMLSRVRQKSCSCPADAPTFEVEAVHFNISPNLSHAIGYTLAFISPNEEIGHGT